MDINIHSNQYITGYPYQGVWEFKSPIQGEFVLQSEHITLIDIPWIWHEVNQLKYYLEIQTNEDIDIFNRTIQFDHIALSYEKDTYRILNSITDTFNTDLSLIGLPVTVDGDFDQYNLRLTFNSPFSFEVTFLWQDEESTISGVFDKEYNEKTSILNIPLRFMIGRPQFLEVCIQEADLIFISPSMPSDRLLFPVESGHIPGQELIFYNATNQLTIHFFRRNIPYTVVPLTNSWDMYLSSDPNHMT